MGGQVHLWECSDLAMGGVRFTCKDVQMYLWWVRFTCGGVQIYLPGVVIRST